MATLRNLVTGLTRQAGYTKIAATIRKIRNNPHLIFTILDLHPTPQNLSRPAETTLRTALPVGGAHVGRRSSVYETTLTSAGWST